MINLELTDVEANTLDQTLEDYLSDLRMEIAGTDSMDYRETLKERKDLLMGLLQRVKAGHA